MMYKLFGVLLLSCSITVQANGVITIVYDAQKDKIYNVPKNILVHHYDVSKVSRIEAEINKRLVYQGPRVSSEKVESWGMKKIKTDPKIKSLVDSLPFAYEYLTVVADYGLTKVPAVVYSDGGKNFVVYGEINISKAIQKINAYRFGTKR